MEKQAHRGRQTEDRLLRNESLCELHIVLKIWEMFHLNPHLEPQG